jgi:hypothetical protein
VAALQGRDRRRRAQAAGGAGPLAPQLTLSPVPIRTVVAPVDEDARQRTVFENLTIRIAAVIMSDIMSPMTIEATV